MLITKIINPSLDFTNVKKLNRKFFWKKVLGVVYIYLRDIYDFVKYIIQILFIEKKIYFY